MNKQHLTITFVVDTYGISTNGTTITAMRCAEALRARGHTVKIITGSPINEHDIYSTGYRKMPILYQITRAQGMFLAKANKKVLSRVIAQSDIVHFLLPFKLQKKGKKIAEQLNIPSSAAFHVQPENITSTLYLDKFSFINNKIYEYFKRYYNQFSHIHCPSSMIAHELTNHHYNAKLHVISNGVDARFKRLKKEKPDVYKDRFILLMIGRLSREKRQDLVIEAVKKSNHEASIQIIFAGQGPTKETIKSLGRKLTHPPIINFFTQDDLQDVINYADLYVHASDIEIEAISCIEAFSCGLVPIISNSKKSATNQFALDENNLFEAGNALSLAAKIDYFYTHEDEKKLYAQRYLDYAKQFQLERSVDQLETMFYETIKDFNH